MNDNEMVRRASVDNQPITTVTEARAYIADVVNRNDEPTTRTYLGNELPEPSMTDPIDPAGCYPKGPTPRQLVDLGPRFIPGTEIQAPDVQDAVVHVWNAFAGLALELGGYQDITVRDPYSGRDLWVPIPNNLRDAGVFAWYQYALAMAERYDWSREGDGGLLPAESE